MKYYQNKIKNYRIKKIDYYMKYNSNKIINIIFDSIFNYIINLIFLKKY